MTFFLRILEASVDDKQHTLLRAVKSILSGEKSCSVFEVSTEGFAAVPGSPFAYWVSDAIRAAFKRNPRFENFTTNRAARQGGVTGDDFRWFRLWTEVDKSAFFIATQPRCVPLAKGGRFSRHYCALPLVARWDDTRNTFWSFTGLPHRPSLQPASTDFYFRPGLTWPRRTNGLSFRPMPRGCVFGDKGPAAFVECDSSRELLALGAIVNSQVFGYLVAIQLARTELAQSYEVGLIQQTPIPYLSEASTSAFALLGRRAWALKRSLDMSNETSHAFLLPPVLLEKCKAIDHISAERELVDIQAQIDGMTFSLYGINNEDRATIETTTKTTTSVSDDVEAKAADDNDEGDDETAESDDLNILKSWLVGVAFGRFDLRLAMGERAMPPEPAPFDPLPSRSPGMYPEGEEPANCPDILVDDEGHADDISARTLAVAESVEVDLREDLRSWLAKEFFPLHIKIYTKSRRKAPIYWQLAPPSAGYSVWLYLHALSKDTLFKVQNDYVAPKLAHEERLLESLTSEIRDGATAAPRKRLAVQETLVEELRAFLDEVKRVAPLWKPNLDDGVTINFAPLWRLVPQNKTWQKELKVIWDALANGRYDWAHLAMHLWPERVVPKCAKDRSLAMAHGLEDVFWVESADGKWAARKTPTKSVDELLKERTSPAVKSALKSLLEAPAASGKSAGRKGGGHLEAAAVTEGEDV